MITKLGSTFDPENLFLVSPESKYTYRDLHIFSNAFRKKLQRKDITLTKPIGLCIPSSDELVFIIAACWFNQIPFVLFNPSCKERTLKEQMKGLNLSIFISQNLEFEVQTESASINIFDLSSMLGKELPKDQESKYDIRSCPNKIFGYFFTSGTSGSPKTVPLKRRQMISAARSSAQNILPSPNEHWLLCLPLHHIGGISVILRSLLYGSAIFRLNSFETNQVCKILSENKNVIAASLVPTMYKRVLDHAAFTPHSCLQAILLGGGPIPLPLLRKSLQRNIPVITSYGMTETCAQIAANTLSENKLNSVGKVFDENKIEIRDENGKEILPQLSGTIWLKGPQIFDGYLNVKYNDSFDTDGWFNTGDFGRLDMENNLYIEARRTDRIITGGENVSPFEVESALLQLNTIKEAAVLGIPDEKWGQKVAAVIVLTDDATTSPSAVQEKLKGSLESYKIPKKIILQKTLPRTATGKIRRLELHNLFQSK